MTGLSCRGTPCPAELHTPCPPEAQERAGKKLLYVMFHVFTLRHTVIDHIYNTHAKAHLWSKVEL